MYKCCNELIFFSDSLNDFLIVNTWLHGLLALKTVFSKMNLVWGGGGGGGDGTLLLSLSMYELGC